MKGLCKVALAMLFVAACGRDGAITDPTAPKAVPLAPGVLALGVDSTTGASIETNKDDYEPGEVVHVVGSGWTPGETVNLHMTEEPNTHADIDANVVADSLGGFSTHYYDVQEHDLGVTFTLTATGQTSGSVAVATFTDNRIIQTVQLQDPVSLAFVSSPTAITVGGLNAFTIRVTANTDAAGGGAAAADDWESTSWEVRGPGPGNGLVASGCDSDNINITTATVGAIHTFSANAPLAAGTYSIEVKAWRSNLCVDGGSSTVTYTSGLVVVAATATTTTLTSAPSPSTVGQSVTFTAAVTPDPAAFGTVRFYEFTGAQTCAALGAAVALGTDNTRPYEYTTTTLTGGSHTVWACFDGAGIYGDSQDDVVHVVNSTVTPTMVVGSSQDPSYFGNSVTFTATLSGLGANNPDGGTINFAYDATSCNTTTGVITGGTSLGSAVIASSQAAVSSATLPVGTRDIMACYAGNGSTIAGATDTYEDQVVNKATTNLSLASNNNPSEFGENVTFTATVAVTNGSVSLTGQTVNFAVDGTCQSNGTISGATQSLGSDNIAGGTAAVSISTLAASVTAYNIVACLGDQATFVGDSDALNQTVNKAVTQVSLVSSPDPSVFGATGLKFTATVSVTPGLGVGTPPGTVTFYYGTACSGTSFGNAAVNGSGVAEITNVVSALLTVSGSPHDIIACFVSSSTNFTDSNGADTHSVTAASSTTAIVANPTSQQYSDKVVLTATVSPKTLNGQTQSGTVQFKLGGSDITGASVALDCSGATCTASYTYPITQQNGTTLNFSAAFTSTNVNFANSSTTTDASVGVTLEDAVVLNETVTPSNILIGQGGTLTFSIKEKNPETNAGSLAAAGDLTKITVPDVVVTGKGILDPSKTITFNTCTFVAGGTALTYTHVLNYTCTFQPVNTADTYEVDININGNYYDGSGATLIQITDPSAGFTTGGGWYWYDQTNFPGEKVNFGFMAKATTNNKKTNFQGSLLVIRHLADGSVIKIKSNVFEGYSILVPATGCPSASFSGKATYSVNGVSQGNFAFTGYGMDCGEPGTADKFGLYHAFSPNAVSTSATAGGLTASAKTIIGGNIQVPQPGGPR